MQISTGSFRFDRRPRLEEAAYFVVLLSTAVTLGAALAHLFALPNKIGLPSEDYFVIQSIYAGWAQIGYAIAVQLVAMLAAMAFSRRQPRVFRFTVAAALCLAAAQIVFWTFTYPANLATENWTTIPDNWDALRRAWEYSHAAGAGLQILAMAALILALLARAQAPVTGMPGRNSSAGIERHARVGS